MAVSYWTNYLGQDVILAEQEAKDERLAIELDNFMESAIGSRPNKGTWI